MCDQCMDLSTEKLVEETGINRGTMTLVDDLTIDSIRIGELSATQGAAPEGDPLYTRKLRLCTYVAALEAFSQQMAKECHAESKLPHPPPSPPHMASLLFGKEDRNIH